LRGAAADARSDIWSFGVMPYEMLSDRRPFTSTTGFDLPASILFEPLAPLPLAIPEQVRAIVSRRLEKDTGRRYQQAGDVRADLDVASQRL
jgi:serine/threonine-protein kinase